MTRHQLEAWITLELLGRDGQVVSRRRFRSRSYVLAFADLLYSQMRQSSQTIKDTDGNNQVVANNAVVFGANAAEAAATFGPVVGTGTTAVAITDYTLQTKIAHGVGADQLFHYITSFIAPTTSGSTRSFQVSRTFGNQSGASITVNEVGLYVEGGSAPSRFCAARDIISGGVEVPDGQALAVTYTISAEV